MLVALKSPVKFFQCFLSVKFRTKFEVLQKSPVVANHWKSFVP